MVVASLAIGIFNMGGRHRAYMATGLAVGGVVVALMGVTVNVAQPGVYGRIDIGTYGPPPVVHPQPVIIVPPPGTDVGWPIQMRLRFQEFLYLLLLLAGAALSYSPLHVLWTGFCIVVLFAEVGYKTLLV